jgi:integrase/recombinase XerD
MCKVPPLQRFDAAVQAFISSRRALGRAIRLDEYVLRRLRAYLSRAGYPDLDGPSFARWRSRLRQCAHNTQVDWAMMVYRFCRYRRRRERRCFLPQRWTLGRHRPYPLPTSIEADQVRRLLDFVAGCPPIVGRPLAHAAHRLAIVLLYTTGLRRGEAARLRMEDVDPESGVVRICGSKFHKYAVPIAMST